MHPVGFEPTPPERLGLKSNAFLARRVTRDQLGHGYKSLSSLLSGATEQLVRLFSRESHSKDLLKERTRPRYLEDGGVGGRRRPGDQRSRHRCRGDERACACGHRREGVVDLHGVPQGLSEVVLRPQQRVYTTFCGTARPHTFLRPGFAASSNASLQLCSDCWRTTETTTSIHLPWPLAKRGVERHRGGHTRTGITHCKLPAKRGSPMPHQ